MGAYTRNTLYYASFEKNLYPLLSATITNGDGDARASYDVNRVGDVSRGFNIFNWRGWRTGFRLLYPPPPPPPALKNNKSSWDTAAWSVRAARASIVHACTSIAAAAHDVKPIVSINNRTRRAAFRIRAAIGFSCDERFAFV